MTGMNILLDESVITTRINLNSPTNLKQNELRGSKSLTLYSDIYKRDNCESLILDNFR